MILSWVINPISPNDVDAKTATRRSKILVFQDWVRGEVEKKGYVELPDEFLADREQVREWMEEELDDMCERIDFVSDDGQEDLKRRMK